MFLTIVGAIVVGWIIIAVALPLLGPYFLVGSVKTIKQAPTGFMILYAWIRGILRWIFSKNFLGLVLLLIFGVGGILVIIGVLEVLILKK